MTSVIPLSALRGRAPDEPDPAALAAALGVPLDLLQRYDRPGPRYTSYPTAVEFHTGFDRAQYLEHLAAAAAKPDEPLSLYVHLPFCEERCSFCGCSVIITKKRDVAARYLDYLDREIDMLASALDGRRGVLQYHWGGGTPTYLSLPQIEALHRRLTAHFDIRAGAEVAIEVDPRVTTFEQLRLLRQLGFNRLSLGIQDFTPEVQSAVNRIQPEALTRALFDEARRLGFESINADLIYGLPLQTTASFARTIAAVSSMQPDRVAVYSYAHVPWIRGNQKKIVVDNLPAGARKLALFAVAIEGFTAAGYRRIGMDHFARPDDELARAAASRTLHRNFMGYTTRPATDMVGLGVSAIGDVAGAFAQNTKKLSTYYADIDAGRFPLERGYRLDDDDQVRRHVITSLMCNFHLQRQDVEQRFGIRFGEYFAAELEELGAGPARDGLLEMNGDALTVTESGRLLVRNICMVFDRHLRLRSSATPVFSRTV
jgi:oxygen-independent coproporphyrinogen III oxidase